MHYLTRLLDSTVIQKAVAAATGIGLISFVIVHMLGNLQLFMGQEAINSYAANLKSLGALLWGARIGLLSLAGLHIAMTVRLQLRNRSARSGKYAVAKSQASTLSSRYMIVSGLVILAFVVFHVAHFNFGWIQSDLYLLTDDQGRHDVYSMVTLGFQDWGIATLYIVAMFFLGSHMTHATFSAIQTLGVSIGGKDTFMKPVAWCVALVTIIGFLVVPVAVLLGWVGSR